MNKKIDVISVTDEIAEGIKTISSAFQQLNSSKLSRRAIRVILKDATKLNMEDIDTILEILPKLESLYLKKSKF